MGSSTMPSAPRGRDIVVVGASLGGVTALERLVAQLPEDLPAAVFLVLHLSADRPSFLPAIPGRSARMPIAAAVHGEPIARGRIYVAPSDYHLGLTSDHVVLSSGPRENMARPAIDVLFR